MITEGRSFFLKFTCRTLAEYSEIICLTMFSLFAIMQYERTGV